jgi:PKD repeat protein
MLAAVMAIGLAVAPPLAAPAAAEPVEAGFRDFDYNNPSQAGVDDVSAARNQSKLWYHDGTWWGLLFQVVALDNHKFFVFRLDMATQQWVNTGVAVEDRNRANMDVLWDGTSVHVASRAPDDSIHYFRLTYDDATDTWAIAQGPIAVPNTADGTGYTTIAKDGTGRLWIVFTDEVAADDNRVRYTTSTDGAAWDSPATLPGSTEHIGGDDVAAVTALSGGVGVLWSEESTTRDGFYFQTHVDGDPVGTWQTVETALDLGANTGDDHVSLKTAPDGRVIAVVKTDMNAAASPSIVVIERAGDADEAGTWDDHLVADGADAATRPVLVLDEGNSQAHVLMTSPVLASDGDQSIYLRSAPLASLDFGDPGVGAAFISSSQDPAVNDITSTKQALGTGWGLVGLAADISTFHYLHGCLGDACTPAPGAPVAAFSASPTSGAAPLAVTFTNTSTNATSWSWNFGDGNTSTEQSPSHTYTAAGTYTVTLTATGAGGSDDEVKTDFIMVSAPPTAGSVDRYAGADRYATAVAISSTHFAANVSVAFVTTGTNFPDALAGAAAAGKLGAPVLLVAPTFIPPAVKTELTRLNPGAIVILGGPGAVSAGVEAELGTMFGAGKISRVAGANRYATAVAISQTYFSPGAPAVFLATGTNFPDALAGSAVAGLVEGPVLLTTPASLPAAVASEITRLAPAKIYILGGTGVVSAAIEAQLAGQFGAGNVVRIAGPDRYSTAAAISTAFFAVNPTAAFVATGLNFPDALAGASPAALTGGPILLVRPGSIPAPIATELARLKPLNVRILGGTGVVSTGVANELAGYLGP